MWNPIGDFQWSCWPPCTHIREREGGREWDLRLVLGEGQWFIQKFMLRPLCIIHRKPPFKRSRPRNRAFHEWDPVCEVVYKKSMFSNVSEKETWLIETMGFSICATIHKKGIIGSIGIPNTQSTIDLRFGERVLFNEVHMSLCWCITP